VLFTSLQACQSYNVLVIALKANEGVPKFEVVTERNLQQERKSKDKLPTTDGALVLQKHFRKRPMRCNHCG